MDKQPDDRVIYQCTARALEAAHKACLHHPRRPLSGMSDGPFSGVNKALGTVNILERALRKIAGGPTAAAPIAKRALADAMVNFEAHHGQAPASADGSEPARHRGGDIDG